MQRSTRQVHLLVLHLVNIKHLTVHCWRNLLWVDSIRLYMLWYYSMYINLKFPNQKYFYYLIKRLVHIQIPKYIIYFINLFHFPKFIFNFSCEQALIVLQQDQSKNNYLFRLLSITLYSNLQLYTLCVLSVWCPFCKNTTQWKSWLLVMSVLVNVFYLLSFSSFYLSVPLGILSLIFLFLRYLLYNQFFSIIFLSSLFVFVLFCLSVCHHLIKTVVLLSLRL